MSENDSITDFIARLTERTVSRQLRWRQLVEKSTRPGDLLTDLLAKRTYGAEGQGVNIEIARHGTVAGPIFILRFVHRDGKVIREWGSDEIPGLSQLFGVVQRAGDQEALDLFRAFEGQTSKKP